MRAVLIAIAGALALSACGKPSDGGGQAPESAGPASPASLPPFVKIYPGARVTKSEANEHGGIIVMEVNAPPDQVMDFYERAAADAGLHRRLDSRAFGFARRSGARIVIFSGAGKQRFTASVESKDGLTKVGLLYGAI